MSNTAEGILHLKKDTQVVSEKFKKREFVIKTEDQYPQYITFQLTQDKCPVLDAYTVGSAITVHFNLRGREWNGPEGVRYFNTLEAWRIEGVAADVQPPSHGDSKPPVHSVNLKDVPPGNPEDELPF